MNNLADTCFDGGKHANHKLGSFIIFLDRADHDWTGTNLIVRGNATLDLRFMVELGWHFKLDLRLQILKFNSMHLLTSILDH